MNGFCGRKNCGIVAVIFISYFHLYYTISYSIPVIHFIALLFILYSMNDIIFCKPYKHIFYLYLSGVTLFIYSLINTFMNESADYSYTYNIFIRYAMFIAMAYVLIKLLIENLKYNKKQFYYFVFYVSFMQTIFIISSMAIPSVKKFFDMLLPVTSYTGLDDIYGIRFRGFSNVANSALSLDVAIGQIFALYLFCNSTRFKEKLFLAFSSLLIFVGVVLCGRTGILFIILCNVMYFINHYKKYYSFLLYIFLISAMSLVFLIPVLNNFDQAQLDNIYRFAFDFIINGGRSSSTDELINKMLFLPDNIKTFVFGDGMYTMPDHINAYMQTDSGFVRDIFSFGVMGCLLFYGSNFLFFASIYQRLLRVDKEIFLFLLFFYMLYNIKGSVFINGSGLTFIIFSFCFFHFQIGNTNAASAGKD
jgi:hypothetical protein